MNVLSATLIIAACAQAVRVDLRRHSKQLFYANVGISPDQGLVVAVLVSAILELVLQLVVRAAGLG